MELVDLVAGGQPVCELGCDIAVGSVVLNDEKAVFVATTDDLIIGTLRLFKYLLI